MAIVKAQVRKQYAIESQMILRMLASGIKLTDAVMSKLDLKAGTAQEKDKESKEVLIKGEPGDNIHFATDSDTGKVYIFKAKEGSVIGATKTFTSSGLKAKLLELADGATIENGEGVVTPATVFKGGLQARFNVANEPVVDGADKYFEVTFDKVVLVTKEEEEEEEGEVKKEVPDKTNSSWE